MRPRIVIHRAVSMFDYSVGKNHTHRSPTKQKHLPSMLVILFALLPPRSILGPSPPCPWKLTSVNCISRVHSFSGF